MKRLFLLIALLCASPLLAQETSSYNFVTTGTKGPGRSFANTTTTAFAISWNTSSTVSSCAVQVDSSADGVSWGSGDLIASQNCAAAGSVAATSLASGKNFVRINVTTLIGNGGLNVTLTGVAGSGSSSPSPGVFSSNFDPPLFQCYSAATGCQAAFTATGPSASIDLRGNPIDTQQLSWRLGGNGVITSTTDTMTYANGNLNTANPNWVFQTGTYTVSSNVAYGQNAALALAYRSDGANTINEWAQSTMVIAATTQATGPCVRMQSGASTAYCLVATSNLLRLFLVSAGVGTALGNYDSQAPVTGDVLKVVAVGSIIMGYKCPGGSNCVLLGSAADTTITTAGFTGLYSNANATSNGVSNFQAGTFVSCNVQIDSSPDGSTWTAGGIMSSQACISANPNSGTGVSASSNFQAAGVANFVRVNVTALTAGQTLTVIYSGRISATPSAIGAPVSNGQWVSAGEVVWAQFTTQGIGTNNYFAGYRLQTAATNGTNALGPTITNSNTISCNTAAISGGSGFGFVIPQSGWLNAVTAYLTSSGFPQGSAYINLYVLPSMPPGGSTSACGGSVGQSTIGGGMLLASCPYGSFYPCSFVGTSSIPISPWSIPGFTTTVTQATPSAGADWTYTGSLTARTCIQSVTAKLITSAAAANRIPVLVITVNGSAIAYPAATAQTASATQFYSWSPGVAENVTGGTNIFHTVPFNNGQLVCFNSGLSTLTVGTQTTAIQAADQWSNISLVVQTQQDNN